MIGQVCVCVCVCYRGPPSGQEQKREEQEVKTLHPVEPRPSLAPTGSAVKPPVKQRLSQFVLKCDRGGTKETETPEPDSVSHNLSHRRTTRWLFPSLETLLPDVGFSSSRC